MDPGDAFSANKFRWDPRPAAPPPPQHHHEPVERTRELEEVFEGYGVRGATVARMGELGFTASTLAGMREEEVDDMMAALAHLFRWDLLVGERYGIKAALRAERRRLDSLRIQQGLQFQHQHLAGVAAGSRPLLLLSPDHPHNLDALSQEGLSEEPVQQEREAAGSGGEGGGRRVSNKGKQQQYQQMKGSSSSKRPKKKKPHGGEDHLSDSDSESEGSGGGFGCAVGERQREHPFIVTEPGEVARAIKNGLDYLFHLYDQCRDFLLQVQAIAKERGDKCPTKVTNQVFRYAKKAGASYINKPKMRHYVHCYALHCLEEEVSNALRRAYKERGENVGAWRQACYKPLVAIAARHGWDIDAVFNAHPRLAIWYVPTKLRQLCHLARSQAAAAAAAAAAAGGSGLGSASASCLPVPPPPPPPPPSMY